MYCTDIYLLILLQKTTLYEGPAWYIEFTHEYISFKKRTGHRMYKFFALVLDKSFINESSLNSDSCITKVPHLEQFILMIQSRHFTAL